MGNSPCPRAQWPGITTTRRGKEHSAQSPCPRAQDLWGRAQRPEEGIFGKSAGPWPGIFGEEQNIRRPEPMSQGPMAQSPCLRAVAKDLLGRTHVQGLSGQRLPHPERRKSTAPRDYDPGHRFCREEHSSQKRGRPQRPEEGKNKMHVPRGPSMIICWRSLCFSDAPPRGDPVIPYVLPMFL